MSARWLETVRLGDVWRNESMTFEQRRDEIVRRVKASNWYRSTDSSVELPDVVDDLAHATDASRFDFAWRYLYDIADWDRVWIDTVSPVRAS